MGHFLLQGGNEFKGRMRQSDLRALELCGGMAAPVVIVATAAAADGNHERAGQNGKNWFEALGARNVSVAPLVDRAGAEDKAVAAMLAQARLIYLLGGFPGYLARTLAGSAAWVAVQTALTAGAVLAGSSAGAMVMCDLFFDPQPREVTRGLGAVTGACVLPHHNTFGHLWAPLLQKELPDITLIGIDEETGMIGDPTQDQWQVLGGGRVTLYIKGCQSAFSDGMNFGLSDGNAVL